uniref:uncharacterized protein LOC120328091 isoform X1 n=1 Tax=Styela clava TaxID=7725 RepID=UPI00193ADEEB|nr:uncharacterized protein LOC120328091 isoform X1 [Styela clava]
MPPEHEGLPETCPQLSDFFSDAFAKSQECRFYAQPSFHYNPSESQNNRTRLYLYSKTFRIRQTANDFNPELLAEVQKYGEIETGIIVGGSAYITMKKRAEAPISMQKLRQLNIDGNVTN